MNYRKFEIKEKLWSWTDEFTIYDDQGIPAYRAKGRKFSFVKELSFYDGQGNYLFTLKQKIWAWRPTFIIEEDGMEICRVVKKYTFKPTIVVDFPGTENDILVKGNFWGNEYKFFKNGEEYAIVSKDI